VVRGRVRQQAQMSTPGGGGQSRGITAKPVAPLKGSFPLDHF
jgi:hypothetical protein